MYESTDEWSRLVSRRSAAIKAYENQQDYDSVAAVVITSAEASLGRDKRHRRNAVISLLGILVGIAAWQIFGEPETWLMVVVGAIAFAVAAYFFGRCDGSADASREICSALTLSGRPFPASDIRS